MVSSGHGRRANPLPIVLFEFTPTVYTIFSTLGESLSSNMSGSRPFLNPAICDTVMPFNYDKRSFRSQTFISSSVSAPTSFAPSTNQLLL